MQKARKFNQKMQKINFSQQLSWFKTSLKSYVPGVFSPGILIFAFHERVNLQSAFDKDGFFKTGDLGYLMTMVIYFLLSW
jgi:hypothetical protein